MKRGRKVRLGNRGDRMSRWTYTQHDDKLRGPPDISVMGRGRSSCSVLESSQNTPRRGQMGHDVLQFEDRCFGHPVLHKRRRIRVGG